MTSGALTKPQGRMSVQCYAWKVDVLLFLHANHDHAEVKESMSEASIAGFWILISIEVSSYREPFQNSLSGGSTLWLMTIDHVHELVVFRPCFSRFIILTSMLSG